MKPLLLTSKACFLAVRRHKLLFTDYIGRTQQEFTARHLPFDSIIIYRAGGNLSFEAVRFLMQNNIPIAHLSWDGTQIGVTLPPVPISGELRLAQYRTFLNEKRREQLALAFVKEKVAKSIDLLRFLKRRYPAIDLAGVESVASTSSPMGVEGKTAEAYWLEFAKVVRQAQPKFVFPGRKQGSNNMGATDPLNSFLNYGYAILEAKVRFSIQKAGLDPDIGFLHSPQVGAVPLVYDIMELFRWLVDLTTIELLETKAVRPEDFRTDPEYKVFLKEDAAHQVVERLSQNFNRMAGVGKQNLKYETVLDLDARKLARHMLADGRGIGFACAFNADDTKADAELGARLLGMGPEERRRLGIPKTTLFHINRNIKAGRPPRIYAKVRERLRS